MIIGINIRDEFDISDAEELIEELRKRKLLTLTEKEVRKKVEKEWKGADWEDLIGDSDLIDFILGELANGYFDWDFIDNGDYFHITVANPEKPIFKKGKIPKEEVEFT